MSHRRTQNMLTENGLSEDFRKAIEKGDENQVRSMLVRENSHNGSGGIHPLLTTKIRKAQEVLTPLHLAVKHGYEKIVKLLLEYGISVSDTDQHKCTALHTAVKDQDGNATIMQLLLNHKDIDVNAVDEYKNTPLKLAAEAGNREAVELLIDSGADITKADIVGNTAIHVAAEKGHFNVLFFLVPKIAQNLTLNYLIGSQNKDQNTPLHMAVKKECQKSVSILLSYGASVSLGTKNQHSETPEQLAENKEIKKLLQDPSKAFEQLKEWLQTSKPSVNVMGMGNQVEADSAGNTEQIPPVTSSSSLLSGLPRLPGPMQYVFHVNAQQFNIKQNFKTEVHSGGCAAIGSNSQVNLGGSAVTPGVCPQPAAESTYNIKVSGGGSAAIGDHSVTNVGTGSPRPPSSASSSGSIEDGSSSEGSENRGNRIEGGYRCPTESGSVGAVAHPIQEDKSSGNPTENASKPPGQLPLPVPEESKKGNTSGATGELSHPVPERACPRTPTENAESDGLFKLPHSVQEESHPRKAELVTSTNSDIPGKLTKEIPSSCDRVATEATEQSEEVKPRRTVDTRNTPAAINAGTVRNSSVEGGTVFSSAPNEPASSECGISAPAVRKVPLKGKMNDSHGNARTYQATGTSGNLEQSNTAVTSSHKNGIGWGQQMQKQGSKGTFALSRAAPKSIENTSTGSGEKLSRVRLSGSPGPSVLLIKRPSAEDQKSVVCGKAPEGGDGLENGATSRLSSSAKEAPHRKERFLREDSSLDGGNPTVERSQNGIAAAATVQDQRANTAGVVSTNTSEQDSASRGGMNTETVIINHEPEDDIGGKKRCDSECAVM